MNEHTPDQRPNDYLFDSEVDDERQRFEPDEYPERHDHLERAWARQQQIVTGVL